MLRHLTILTLTVFSLQSFAGNFDFLRGQKELQKSMESGNFHWALNAWETSTRGTAFAESQTGVATLAYLLYQNGLPYTALNTLLSNTQPSGIDQGLMKLWTLELKNSVIIQKGWINTTGGWKSVVNNDPVSIRIKNKSDIIKAFARANSLGQNNLNEKARILWQIATQAPLLNEADASLKALNILKKSGQTVIGQDELLMTQGRVLYQKNNLLASISAFEQIPKGSSLWVESVEERAWAHLRRDDFDKALGVVTTAMSPVLAPLAGPETFFLANLMAYKACDYSRVFDNSEVFKKRHHARLLNIQDLAQKGTSSTIAEVLSRFEKNGVSQESAGPMVELIPRGLVRDQQFVRNMESRRLILAEVAKAGEVLSTPNALVTRSLTNEKAQVDRMKLLAMKRVSALAQNDLKEYRMILNKMHIIEGEIIERLHMDDNLKGERGKLSQIEESNSDTLIFPVTNEVWMDELDNYKGRVKDCPTLKKASL